MPVAASSLPVLCCCPRRPSLKNATRARASADASASGTDRRTGVVAGIVVVVVVVVAGVVAGVEVEVEAEAASVDPSAASVDPSAASTSFSDASRASRAARWTVATSSSRRAAARVAEALDIFFEVAERPRGGERWTVTEERRGTPRTFFASFRRLL